MTEEINWDVKQQRKHVINPYKPSVLFVGHMQTAQTQHSRRRTRHLIRVSTVCSQNVLLEFE